MSDPSKPTTDRFNTSLTTLTESRQQLERMLQRMFAALEEKKIRTNVDPQALLAGLQEAETKVLEQSEKMKWLLGQSFELARTTLLISASLDFEQVIEEVMDTVIYLTNAERAYLLLADQGGGLSVVAARSAERENLLAEDVVFSHAVIELVMEKKTPIITADALDDTRFRGASSVVAHALRSVLCIPLVLRGDPIGVLYADNPIQKAIFKQDSLPIINAFAQQTAIAIENARLYTALEQANRSLNEANRLKSEFLSVISHELKTPFAGIGFALQTFPRYGLDHLTPDQRKVWDELVQGVEQAQKLTTNLVNYAGLLSKQGQLNRQPVDLYQLISDVCLDAQRMARSRNITLNENIPLDLTYPSGDYDRLSEALWHLIQNAIQYNTPNGSVTISALKTKTEVQIAVQDTGVGIPEEHQARIWEAFEQISDSLRRGVEGLGLGLPLVRYVALAHGGEVFLESEVGVGSTFTLVLPLGVA